MSNILKFPAQPVKLGFQRARKKSKEKSKDLHPDQFNLFNVPKSNILNLIPNTSLFEQALASDERGDDAAEKLYHQAIEGGDNLADAYCNLGIIESKHQHTTRALDSFTRALAQDPRHGETHYNLGNLYFELGNHRLARVHYEFAADIIPEFPNVHYNLGLLLAMESEYPSAIKSLLRFRELDEAHFADDLLKNLRQTDGIASEN